MALIDPSAMIGPGCQIGEQAVIGPGVVLGAGVVIGHFVVLHAGTLLDDGVWVGDHAVLGRPTRPARTSTVKAEPLPPLQIAEGALIGTGTVIYAGTRIGEETLIADQAFVRERCVIGRNVIVGRGVAVENGTSIGDYTKIQTGAYITAYVVIEERCFIAPCVVTTNDNFMGRTQERFEHIRGATIRRGARIGANSTLLPGVEIGAEAFVAAGALVTRDVPPGMLVMGAPARVVRPVPPHEFVDELS
jgi:UDP-2-acetamido-3-amino-2,3-dideoxy-glucuronate N-acetyltransferase